MTFVDRLHGTGFAETVSSLPGKRMLRAGRRRRQFL